MSSATVSRNSGSAAYRLFLLTNEMARPGTSYSSDERLAWHKSVAAMPNPYQASTETTSQQQSSMNHSTSSQRPTQP
ncbi:hypothetical protein S40288_11341 [Stachybotrys chartarum IBT 40288]|nr:hypothetical protein S40288_11341 [Stachybotrys chartarum IBT 40288]